MCRRTHGDEQIAELLVRPGIGPGSAPARQRGRARGQATLSWTTYPRYSRYLRMEVRRASGGINTTVPNAMVAMTNPIFLGAG